MTAFSRQDRPTSADSSSVVSAAIIFLAVAVVIVTTPARALRQVVLENAIDYFDGVAHQRIVRRSNAESNQMKDSIPDDMVFVDAPPAKTVGPVRPGSPPKADANDKRYTVGSVQIGLREIDGKWYVSQSPY